VLTYDEWGKTIASLRKGKHIPHVEKMFTHRKGERRKSSKGHVDHLILSGENERGSSSARERSSVHEAGGRPGPTICLGDA